MNTKNRNALLGIDIQNDFCLPTGSLFVSGADHSCSNTAALIRNNMSVIDAILLTQDTHHPKDIAHPSWFVDKDGNNPAPYTVIKASEIFSIWTPTVDPMGTKAYLEALETNGEYVHVIWPEHCIVGTAGHNFESTVFDAVLDWERAQGGWFSVYQKGEVPHTEHFGALRANVVLPNFPSTNINYTVTNTLKKYKRVYLFGQAKSHCVANTLKQVIEYAPELLPKLYIVEDCMNDVPTFEGFADAIFDEAYSKGATAVSSTDPNFLT